METSKKQKGERKRYVAGLYDNSKYLI